MAARAKALGDPVRLQLADVLSKHAGDGCELVPMFDMAHPEATLQIVRRARIVD